MPCWIMTSGNILYGNPGLL